MLLLALSIVTGLYFAMLIGIRMGWHRVEPARPTHSSPSFSIIVAARNEEDNLPALLTALTLQTYDSRRVEVLVVDDHSEDETVRVARAFEGKLNLRVHSLQGENGKYAAMEAGCDLAQNEWLVFTDADVTVHPQWLESLANATDDADWVSAMVAINRDTSWLHTFEAYDMAGLMAVTVATFGWGRPGLANGANMAVKKQLAIDAEVFPSLKQWQSGGDVKMLERIARMPGARLRFQNNYPATVFTRPQAGIGQLLHQRQRWASRALVFNNPLVHLIMTFGFLANAWVLVLVALSFFHPAAAYHLAAFFSLKVIFEAIAIHPVLKACGQSRGFLIHHIGVALIYPAYITTVGFLGTFVSYSWKGRAKR